MDLSLSPFIELGSFGLLAVLVLRFASKIEAALDTHRRAIELQTRVVAELVSALARHGVPPPPSAQRASDRALREIRTRQGEDDA